MNLPFEVIASIGSVGGIILVALYKFMRGVEVDTTKRIDMHVSEANKKLEEIQTVATYLQGQVVAIQADNIKLLRQLLDMENRETVREKELGEAKTQTIEAQANQARAEHLQADAEKERDSANEGRKQALELVEIQSKAIQEANTQIVELRNQIHESRLETTMWKNKYEGALEMAGAFTIQVPAPLAAPVQLQEVEFADKSPKEDPREG